MKSLLIRFMASVLALSSFAVSFAEDAPAFPQEWRVFLFPGRDCQPGSDVLGTIPDSIDGVTPITKALVEHEINLTRDFGELDSRNHAWLFASLEAPRDMDYLVGFGADWWFDCYLNGKKVEGTFPQGNVLHPPQYTDHKFTLKLKKGLNVIAVKFRSGDASSVIAMGGPEELKAFELSPRVRERMAFYTQRGVPLEVENVVPKDLPDKLEKGLAPAGYVVDSYWKKLLKPLTSTLRDRANRGESRGEAQVLSAVFKGAALTVTIAGTPSLTPEDEFYVILRSLRGQELYGRIATLGEFGAQFGEDGVVTITIPDLKNMPYGAAVKGTLEAGVACRKSVVQCSTDIVLGGKVCPGKTAVLRIEDGPAGPTPMLNGKPFFFTCFTIHPYVPERTIPTGMEGPGSPVNVVAARFSGNGASADWWYGPGQYDFTTVDWCLNGLIRDFPDAKIAIYLWCHPGNWYGELYPERLSRDENGEAPMDYYVAKVSFDNPDVRKDTLAAVDAFAKHCEEYFSSKIVIYNLMGGISCEWQGWNSHSAKFSDYSDQSLLDFQAYAAERGIAVDHIPTPEEHRRSNGGVFRNPVTDQKTMLYDRFYSESISEFIDQIAGTIKAVCKGDKLVGAYYGYHLEYSNLGYTGNRAGHNDLTRLLNSPNVDFFLSPQSYSVRALGNPNADMKPYGAMRLAGKFSIMEDDTRTHKLDQCGYNQALNLDQTLRLLTRNIGMYLCHRMPINQLGEHGGDEMAEPELREFYGKILQAGQFVMEQTGEDPTQIAAVVDEKAIQYLAARRQQVSAPDEDSYNYGYDGKLNLSPSRSMMPLSGESISYQRFPLAHVGAPVDIILLEDVARTAGKYKVVIFLNAYKDSPKLRRAIQLLREKDVAIVSLYGTGFLDDKGLSTKTMSEILGIRMGQTANGSLQLKFPDGRLCGASYSMDPRFVVDDKECETFAVYAEGNAVAVARKGNTYFYGGAYLDEAFLRQVAREQGVHIYLETGDNLYAGANVLSIHAKYTGSKQIKLPRNCTVVDAISGEVVAENASEFTVDMKATDSRIFLLK